MCTSTTFTAAFELPGYGAVFATFHRGIGLVAADGTDVDLWGVNLETLRCMTQRAAMRAVKTYGYAVYGCRIPTAKIGRINAWKTLPEMLTHEYLGKSGVTLAEIQACYTESASQAA